ncbi:MAG: hypothetical protein R3F43_20535 [bacterium]
MRGSVGLPVVVLLAVQAAGALGLPFLWTSTFGPGATSAPGAALAPAYLALGAYLVAGGVGCLARGRGDPTYARVAGRAPLGGPGPAGGLRGVLRDCLLLACARVFLSPAPGEWWGAECPGGGPPIAFA